MSRVIFHSDAFASASRYGLARYARELYESLQALEPAPELVPFSSRCRLDAAGRERLVREHGFIDPGWHHRALVLSWTLLGRPKLERWCPDADLVHTVELDYPVATSKPWVVTVHDLGPLSHPQYFSESRPWMRRRGIDCAAARADIIVCVSQATADAVDSVAAGPVADRIRVVPEGVSAYFFEAPPADCLAPLQDLPESGRPYFLWTGSLNPRKNLDNVLTAFELVAADIDESLVIAGGLGWDSHGLLQRIEDSVYRDRIHRPGFVSDDQLKALYRGANAFIYVSFMEGFGLPILEAMAGGCPVVTSDLSSMPEVAGEAGVLVDPHDSVAIAGAMRGLSGDAARRRMLAHAGIAHARGFGWDTCASAMRDIYDELL